MIINKNKGILFRISGLPGSGKTRLARKLLPGIRKKFGPTIMWSGDDIRRIFKNRKYTAKERIKFGIKIIKLIKFITNQKINVIFATVGLEENTRKLTKKNINNYLEIFIKADIAKLKKLKMRKFYNDGSKNVWGKDIKAEFPKKPHIRIFNNFKTNLNKITQEIITKIDKII
tara:strand:- start:1467 stop:1985 length:519 start_codon:yes stop_codon:yes gene_type:complete